MALHRTAPVDAGALLADYPFLPGAERLVDGLGLTLADLLGAPEHAHARELAHRRILSAVEDPRSPPDREGIERALPAERYLSFLYARLLLNALDARGALRRFAVAEAKESSGRLTPGPSGDLGEVARRLGYALEEGPDGCRLPVPDYLRLATPIREADFRLVGQSVDRGAVLVPPDRAARLLQEGIRRTIAEPIELDVALLRAIREREGPFLSEVAQRAPTPTARPGALGPLVPERFPPCIRKMRRTLQAGENLSHAGRFALAAFLHRAGADPETIVDAYRGAPDFDEGITRYQVEHITQHAGGSGYEPPTCATLRSHGLCARDGDPSATEPRDRARDPKCFADWLKHPMQYYRPPAGGSAR